ncbi:MAG TPA: hypothetical protein DCE44_01185, partial [Verrucomicrobiales bacterium]|nr:hypothetical protein [Verrucomicrobiales bacterium]
PRFALCVPISTPTTPSRILDGVGELALPSCATVSKTATVQLELEVTSPATSAILHPLGHIRPDGGRPVVESWILHDHRAAPVLAALRSGKGKVAVVGTWKFVTLDAVNNWRLFENLLAWLSSPE